MNIKLFIFIIGYFFFAVGAKAQGNTWVWMNGPQYNDATSAFCAAVGVPGPNNHPAGISDEPYWIDLNGKFWILNGEIYEPQLYHPQGYVNSLWMYDPLINEWTCVRTDTTATGADIYGTLRAPSVNNRPLFRTGAAYWTDNNGNLWLFGGNEEGSGGFTGGNKNDIWRYQIAANEWTWMGGPTDSNNAGSFGTIGVTAATNLPPARSFCSSWADIHNGLWIFGGSLLNGSLNDLWRYDIGTNQWTWMKGDSTLNGSGAYGRLNVESAANLPGARYSYSHMRDAAGNFYLYGGAGIANNQAGELDDVWKYDILTNNWVWVAGSPNSNIPGFVQTQCTYTGDPGSRSDNPTPQVNGSRNTTLFFGGIIFGNPAAGSGDAWFFNTQTGQWKFVSPDNNFPDYEAFYIAMGAQGYHNTPGGRTGAANWVDNTGALWVFGGNGEFIDGSTYFNDMWRWLPDTGCIGAGIANPIAYLLSANGICAGDTSVITIGGIRNIQISPSNSVQWLDSVHAKLFPLVTTSYVITGSNGYSANDSLIVQLIVHTPGSLYYQLTDTSLVCGDTAILTLPQDTNVVIVPTGYISRADSSHIYFYPDTTTTYHIYGQSVCGTGTDSATFTIHQVQPIVSCNLADTVVCASTFYSTTLYVHGLLNATIFPAPPHSTIAVYTDNTDCYFPNLEATVTTTYKVAGYTICGLPDTVSAPTLYALPLPNYSVSQKFICQGDSAEVSLTAFLSAQITPSTRVRWVDSAHAFLFPDTTTTYTLTGRTCNGFPAYQFTLQVSNPGSATYTLSSPGSICTGSQDILYIYGVDSPVVSPASTMHFVDSIYSYTYLAPTSTTTYTITGQSGCSDKSRDTTQFTLQAYPNAGYTLHTSTICNGDSSLLTIRGLVNMQITPATGVAWVDSAADSSHLYLYPDTATQYSLHGTNCSGGIVYYDITVGVNKSYHLSYTTSSTGICNGDSVYLAVNGVPNPVITPAVTLHAIDSINYYTYLKPADTTVYIISSTSLCAIQKDSFTVYVSSSSYTIALSKPQVCKGDSATLNLTGISNLLISPSISINQADSLHVILFPDSSTTYAVSGQTLCGSNFSQNISLTVIQPSPISYLVDSGICQGDSATLNLSGISNPAISPSINTNAVDSSHIVLFPDSNTTYTLMGQTSCGSSYLQYINITVFPPLPVVFHLSDSAICHGDSAILDISGFSGNLSISPSAGVIRQDSSQIILSPDSTTTYIITSENSCGNIYSTTITEHIFASPLINIVAAADTLTATTSTGGIFTWYLNGTVITGAIAATIIATGEGSYSATLADSNGCTASSNTVVITGIENSDRNNISIYPNPTNNTWRLSVAPSLTGGVMEIFNAAGQLVWQSTINHQQSTIQIPNAASGVYELRIISPQVNFVKKLVKL